MDNKHSATKIVILFLISGFIYTFSYKLQGSQTVRQGSQQSVIVKKFFHPYMQAVSFFFGESLCLLTLYFKQGELKKRTYSTKIFIIPAMSDLFSVMLQCSALALISGSTFMMLKGASIITTLIFSRFLINFQIKFRHLTGCLLAVIGLIIVGLTDIYLRVDPPTVMSSESQQTIGYVLMITSLIFNGFLYAYQQKLLIQHQVSPIDMVGWQGVYGFVMSLVIVIVLNFTPCPYPGNKCVFDERNEPYTQLIFVYFQQIFSSFLLFFLVISGLVSNAFYNFYGVTITQTMDSLTRSLLNVCRTALIWIFGIFISLNVSQQSPYRIQSLQLSVNFVKFIGFFCIILGTLIYNKIVLNQTMEKLNQKYLSKFQMKQKLLLQKDGEKQQKEKQIIFAKKFTYQTQLQDLQNIKK